MLYGINSYQLEQWSRERQQFLMEDYQEAIADRAVILAHLGTVANWLGRILVHWGTTIAARAQEERRKAMMFSQVHQ